LCRWSSDGRRRRRRGPWRCAGDRRCAAAGRSSWRAAIFPITDAETAAALDAVVIDCVARFDDDGLQRALDARPDHACGGGPMVAVMRAARLAGAGDAVVLNYADSGDVSGDKSAVVGYLAAALGTFNRGDRRER
jgi:predicted class III extradiol MEMO1 family dioxygenase